EAEAEHPGRAEAAGAAEAETGRAEAEVMGAAVAEAGPEEKRRVARLDPLPQRVRLLLRDLAGGERLGDLVDRGRLGRVLELLGRDAEMLRQRLHEAGR